MFGWFSTRPNITGITGTRVSIVTIAGSCWYPNGIAQVGGRAGISVFYGVLTPPAWRNNQ